eukprot:gene3069-1353_t
MELHFLGTGSCYPSPKRGASCVAFRSETAGVWLFDCGEGSQIQLQRSEIKPGRITKIFITHLHGDHLFGLPGLMCTISQNNIPEDKVIDIYGPKGLAEYLRISLNVSCSQLGYKYFVHEILEHGDTGTPVHTTLHPNEKDTPEVISKNSDRGSWRVCKSGNFSVEAFPLVHAIFSVGYVITEDDLPGKLDPALLKSKGVAPGPIYGKIKKGESVTLEDGTVLEPSSLLGPPRKGRIIILLGDTANSDSLIGKIDKVDVLVHETTVENEMEDLAIERGHSTPGMAGKFATRIGAKKLIISHFSQRYRPIDSVLKGDEVSVSKLLQQAKENFATEVIAADDFKIVAIETPK